MSTWTVTVNIPSNMWMSANRPIRHHAQRQRIIRDLQWLITAAINSQQPGPLPDPCTLTWTIQYPKGTTRKADAPNSYPTCKALLDGIVQTGVIKDDNNTHITAQTWQRGPNLTRTGRHQITITGSRDHLEADE